MPVAERTTPDAKVLSWRVLRHGKYRAFLIACTTSNLGTWLQSTAQVLLAYRFTHSALDVGVITSAQYAGFLIFGPWTGGLADKIGPRRVLLSTQIFSAVVASVIAYLKLTGHLTEAALVGGALATGLALTFALPVQNAMAPALAPPGDKDSVVEINQVSYNVGRTLAPVLYLAVLVSIGAGWAFALNAVSFVIFAITTAIVCPRKSDIEAVPARRLTSLRLALERPRILLLLVIVASVTFADDPVTVLGPPLAHQLHISSTWPAYFMSALGLGAVLGSLIPKGPARTRPTTVFLGLLALSVLVFAAGLAAWLSVLAAVVAGVSALLTGAACQATLLETGGPARRVQVMALWSVAWAGTKPIASLTDGLLASNLGIRSAALILASPAILIAVIGLILPQSVTERIKAEVKSRLPGPEPVPVPQPDMVIRGMTLHDAESWVSRSTGSYPPPSNGPDRAKSASNGQQAAAGPGSTSASRALGRRTGPGDSRAAED